MYASPKLTPDHKLKLYVSPNLTPNLTQGTLEKYQKSHNHFQNETITKFQTSLKSMNWFIKNKPV